MQDAVWPLSTGSGVTVAVIDSGVNAKLPELSGAVLPGLDLAGGRSKGQVDSDKDGHGTGMAALIAGQGGGTSGFVGLAPDAKILPVRLPPSSAGAWDSLIAKGIRWATDRGAKVINMSVGQQSFRCPTELMEAVAYAIQHDVVMIASTGNDGQGENIPELPGRCPGVVAVGAVTKATEPWVDTQRQNYVTLAAPGAQMGAIDSRGTYYPNSRGTSNAAALASAAVALIRSRNPGMTGRTIVQRLIATAMPIGKKAWNPQTGYGLILVRGAMDPVKYPLKAGTPNPVYEAFDRWKASTYRAPSQPVTTAARKKGVRSGGTSTSAVVAGVATAVLVIGGLLTGMLVMSRRRGLDRTSHP